MFAPMAGCSRCPIRPSRPMGCNRSSLSCGSSRDEFDARSRHQWEPCDVVRGSSTFTGGNAMKSFLIVPLVAVLGSAAVACQSDDDDAQVAASGGGAGSGGAASEAGTGGASTGGSVGTGGSGGETGDASTGVGGSA